VREPEAQVSGDDEVAALLVHCTEAGRLKRATKLVDKVDFLLGDGELIIAAVANYNVVIDIAARRIQHGCRDFRGQAAARHLCKHVAATVMALDESLARQLAAELAECAAAPPSGVVVPWRLEVITRFTPGG
jgi:hypothetical protein